MQEALLGGKQAIKNIIDKRWAGNGAFGALSLQYMSAKVDNFIYLIGGRVGLGTPGRNAVYRYDDAGQTNVATLANIPATLLGAAAVAIGRLIYVVGGCYSINNGQENKKVYIYDIDANSWSTGPTDCPVPAVVTSAVVIGTDIYMYGGAASQVETGYAKVFYKYDTVNKTWTALPYHDGNPLLATACVLIGGLIYAFGGEYNSSSFFDSDIRVYDPVAATWSKPTITGSKPGGRGGVGMVKYDATRFIITGGRVTNGSTVTAETWIFDTVTVKWTQLPSMPVGQAFHRCELLAGNDPVVFDGYTGPSTNSNSYRLT